MLLIERDNVNKPSKRHNGRRLCSSDHPFLDQWLVIYSWTRAYRFRTRFLKVPSRNYSISLLGWLYSTWNELFRHHSISKPSPPDRRLSWGSLWNSVTIRMDPWHVPWFYWQHEKGCCHHFLAWQLFLFSVSYDDSATKWHDYLQNMEKGGSRISWMSSKKNS